MGTLGQSCCRPPVVVGVNANFYITSSCCCPLLATSPVNGEYPF
uniref:Uncharacterized protein n=1 Tax=Anguilla anguilla TaxID=7936 RepID=A0A0E9WUW4_ANGAN